MISKKGIEKLAFLSKIRMKEEDSKTIAEDLESILKYIQKLSNIDTENVEPLFHFPEIKNIVRDDKPELVSKETKKRMMGMGKDKDDYLKVESIL